MSKVQIRIVLVDDHKIVREAWRTMLGFNDSFTVVGECDNGYSAMELIEKIETDVIIMDVNMAPINGFELAKIISDTHPLIKIIGVSVNNDSRYAARMIESGAQGFLTKTTSVDEIIDGIQKVYNGETYICEEVRNKMS